MEAAAEAAGLSVRTLRRRLGEFGTSYSDVVARTRVTLAERWLAEQDRSITDIASALGYANRSNFARAFRRLNGMSPQAYRHTVIQSDRRKKSTLA
jgi:AraC-like DNA-binding protein